MSVVDDVTHEVGRTNAHFLVTTRDVGLTQVATVWYGTQRIIEFYTHTRHEDRSMEAADKVIADALRPLFEAVLEQNRCSPWAGAPGGMHT